MNPTTKIENTPSAPAVSNSASSTETIPASVGNTSSYTANPKAPKGDSIDESTGPVASDSLAAESVKAGGEFSKNANPDVQPVKGSQSTFANTDTSNATVIPPSTSGSEREKMTESESYKQPSDSSNYEATNQSGGQGSASASDAPTYAADTKTSDQAKPKGDNVTEDPSLRENDDPLGDVNSKNNPSRLAEKTVLKESNDASNGLVRDQTDVNSGTKYDALESSENA